MSDNGTQMLVDLPLPDGGRIAVYCAPSDHHVGRWTEVRTVLERNGCDTVLQEDYLDDALSIWTALQRAAEGGLEHVQRALPLGLLYNRAAYRGGADDPSSDYCSRFVVLGYKDVVSFIYTVHGRVFFEVSPFCPHIFGDWPEELRHTEVSRFLANVTPILQVEIADEMLRVWMNRLNAFVADLSP